MAALLEEMKEGGRVVLSREVAMGWTGRPRMKRMKVPRSPL